LPSLNGRGVRPQSSLDPIHDQGHCLRVVAEGWDPVDLGLAAEPGELAFGIVAMALLGGSYRFFNRQRVPEHLEGLPVAEGVEGFDGAVAIKEGAGFVDEAGGEHLGGAAVEAIIEGLAGRVEADAEKAEAGEGVAGGRGVQDLGERGARSEADLNGADEFGNVVGVDAGGGGGIEALEQAMEPCFAVACEAALEAGAEIGLAGGAGKEAFGEGAEVEASSARDDGEAAAGDDFRESGTGGTAVCAGGEGLIGVADVDEVVGQAGLLGWSGLGGAEVHAAVDGYRVATDDFAVESLTEGEGEGGFAAAGGPEQEDNERVRCGGGQRLRRSHGRHHPGGKIQRGLVWQSHQARMAAAMRSRPKSWLRRKMRVWRARCACSACACGYGLMRDSTMGAMLLGRGGWATGTSRTSIGEGEMFAAWAPGLTSLPRFAQITFHELEA